MVSRRAILVLVSFLALVLNSVFLVFLVRQPHNGYGTEMASLELAGILQDSSSSFIRTLRGWWRHYFQLASVSRENDRLQAALEKARFQNHRMHELELENARLRRLLQLDLPKDHGMVTAEVIARNPSAWFHGFIVNCGRADGIQTGCPVMTPDGAVGVVVSVSRHYAKVQTLMDPGCAIDGMAQHSRARGMVKAADAGALGFVYFLRRNSVAVGEKILTSGMDGIFPKGILVGTVADIQDRPESLFRRIKIDSPVDTETLEEVMILKSPPKPADLFAR